jgi:hypothetical protein
MSRAHWQHLLSPQRHISGWQLPGAPGSSVTCSECEMQRKQAVISLPVNVVDAGHNHIIKVNLRHYWAGQFLAGKATPTRRAGESPLPAPVTAPRHFHPGSRLRPTLTLAQRTRKQRLANLCKTSVFGNSRRAVVKRENRARYCARHCGRHLGLCTRAGIGVGFLGGRDSGVQRRCMKIG